jgi:hypothetical protein
MSKYGTALLLLFAASCVVASDKSKADKFLPPVKSHGMTISGYGCDRLYVSSSTSTSKLTSYWTLLVWAQYGEKHNRYWQKSYGTYEIPVQNSVNSSGESAGSGAVIGGYELKSYDFTSMDKACADWGAKVESIMKIEANGNEKPKE